MYHLLYLCYCSGALNLLIISYLLPLLCEDVRNEMPTSPVPRVPDKTEHLSGSGSDDPDAIGGTSHTLKPKNDFHHMSDTQLAACKEAIWQVRELAEYFKTPQSRERAHVRELLLAEMHQLQFTLTTLTYPLYTLYCD